MAYTFGDIVEVSWLQEMFSQVIMNIQHYRVVSSGSSSSDVADNQTFADHLAALTGGAELIGIWSDPLGAEWILRDVRAQKIDPVRSAYANAAINQSGQGGAGADVTNTAVVVSKRGGSGTRRAQGSIHFAGWIPTFFTGGEIQAGVETWWASLQPLWAATQNVVTGSISLQPVIYNPGATPNFQTVAFWTLQDTVRVMRRRTVRVGI